MILNAHAEYIRSESYEENLRQLHENAQACGADRRKSPAPRRASAPPGSCHLRSVRATSRGVRYYVNRHGELVPEYIC